MPPKKSNENGEKKPQDESKSDKKAVSDEEVRQESGKAADAAISAQKKARELTEAANAAGDPDERERLTKEATNASIEAESFGKTAKYLRSGAFQGAAMGTGLGVAPGASLGAITGTLVGGISSTLLGGVGAGIGGATGAIHGPFVNMGSLAGKGMKKLTGWLPSWAVSEEQKQSLAKMIGQVKEQKMPGAEELEKLKSEGGGGKADKGWMESAKGMMPDQNEVSDAAKRGAQATGGNDSKSSEGQPDQASSGESKQKNDGQGRKKPRKLNAKPSGSEAPSTNGDHNEPAESASEEKPPSAPNANQDLEERTKKLDQREADLDRRQAELDEREKTLAQREQESGPKPESGTSEPREAPKTKGNPRKLQSRT
jgi:hypothetical protein